MRIITYKCDFCREEIKDLNNLKTIYWKSDILPQRYILKNVDKQEPTDKQICIDCIEMIRGAEIK